MSEFTRQNERRMAAVFVRSVWANNSAALIGANPNNPDGVFDSLARMILPAEQSDTRAALVAALLELRAFVRPNPAWTPPLPAGPQQNACEYISTTASLLHERS